ncbi:toll-like receptor 13 [Littorina saxatilis]|uniref:toll-like receptor 13 n=1 Tax=Littorina saxatilis TaxID=31220 RepID=UPI0038B4C680
MKLPVIKTKMLLLYFFLQYVEFLLVFGSKFICGDGHFRCLGNEATCISKQELNYIPELPDHIQKVDILLGDVERIDSPDFFQNVTHISSLSMIRSGLTYIAPGAFDILQNLTSLDIGANQLDALPENTFSPETRSRLLHFDATENNFHCRCDLIWFSEWLISNSSVFHPPGIKKYFCVNKYFLGKPLLINIVELRGLDKQACLMSGDYLAFIIFILSVLLGSFVFYLFLKIYCSPKLTTVKQRVLLPFRLLRTKLHTFVCTTNVAFKYDVFVAYAEEDNDFVSDHLRPRLEDELGLKLCLHQRDFHPGRNILENIEDSVTSSKKVLMVFTTHFAHSPWCQFELALCQRHAMDHGDLLLVVHVNNTPVSDLTPTMTAIVRTCTYIAWSQAGEGRVIFWNSLLLALGDVLTTHAPRSLQRRQQQRQQQGEMNQDEEQAGETVIV